MLISDSVTVIYIGEEVGLCQQIPRIQPFTHDQIKLTTIGLTQAVFASKFDVQKGQFGNSRRSLKEYIFPDQLITTITDITFTSNSRAKNANPNPLLRLMWAEQELEGQKHLTTRMAYGVGSRDYRVMLNKEFEDLQRVEGIRYIESLAEARRIPFLNRLDELKRKTPVPQVISRLPTALIRIGALSLAFPQYDIQETKMVYDSKLSIFISE